MLRMHMVLTQFQMQHSCEETSRTEMYGIKSKVPAGVPLPVSPHLSPVATAARCLSTDHGWASHARTPGGTACGFKVILVKVYTGETTLPIKLYVLFLLFNLIS